MSKQPARKSRRKDDAEIKPDFDVPEFSGKNPKEKKPGKDRFFEQNYKHSLVNDEEYVCCFELHLKEDDYNRVQKLLDNADFRTEFDKEVLDFLEDSFYVGAWDRFEQDMRKLSKKFKNCLFKVHGYGEDFPYDLFVACSLNGKFYHQNFDLVFPDFNRELLM